MWEVGCWTTVALAGAVLLLLYKWITKDHDFWLKRGVKFVKPVPIFGTMLSTVLRKDSMTECFEKLYYELKSHKIGGFFEFMTPALLVTDPELIREITVKNFDYFFDRRSIIDKKTEPLFGRALPSLKGEEWRSMRNRLSPAFTTSKLRTMFPLITKCGHQFAHFLVTRKDAHTEPLEFKSAFTRLTNDVIASTAFGVECNAVENTEEQFYKHGQDLTNFSGIRSLLVFGLMLCPKLFQFLKITFTPKKTSDFFIGIINKAMNHREASGEIRPDMLQLLLEAQKGDIKRAQGDEQDDGAVGEGEGALDLHKKHMKASNNGNHVISNEDIVAQAFIFFFAGFETVATMLSFLAHELAVNPDVQERLRDEVDAALMDNDNVLTYETIQKLKYLDMVVSESLRKYPPAGFTDRRCVKSFKIPGSNVIIEKDMVVMIPMYPMHKDPEYFPEPEKFDPERFSDENKGNIRPYTYLPFGSGPHNCIGMRFALLEVKVAVCYLLATCELHVCAKTEVPLKLSKKTFQMTTDAGFMLLATPRDNPTIIV